MNSTTYVQYGCGLCAPSEWVNYDASPTLLLQKLPLVGPLLKNQLNVVFPENVRFGDIIKGLPDVEDNSCSGVYSSHTLEHLSLADFRQALRNTYRILRPDGIFRLVVPDLEVAVRNYLDMLEHGQSDASLKFIGTDTLLGQFERPRGLKGYLTTVLGNSHHLWMWDFASMSKELAEAGFLDIRRCQFNDSTDPMFSFVEDPSRFENALAIECRK